MSFPLFSNSSTVVNLDPEYGFEVKSKKIESTYRATNGALLTYKWGIYAGWKIPLKYLDASQRTQLNTWWQNNTNLVFQFQSSNYAVRIVNKDTPIDKYIKPYDDMFEGVLELESYQ